MGESEVAHCAGLLNAEETQRAGRFVFDVHRRRFTLARGILRVLASRLVREPAHALKFSQGAHGKPALSHPAESGLELNVSHSGDEALYAFGWRQPLGVDVECVRPIEYLALAKHSFSEQEQQTLEALPESELPAAFFACWSRKEAFIKALGEGLSFPLRDFDVDPLPDKPPRLLKNRRDHDEAHWVMQALPDIPGAHSALCMSGPPPGKTVRSFRFDPAGLR
jgi:4'-phosphopantetheinyl transferase